VEILANTDNPVRFQKVLRVVSNWIVHNENKFIHRVISDVHEMG